MSQAFFRGDPAKPLGALEPAERLEIRAYDKDGQVVGHIALAGRVRLSEPIDLTPRMDGWSIGLNLEGYEFTMPIDPPAGPPTGASQ